MKSNSNLPSTIKIRYEGFKKSTVVWLGAKYAMFVGTLLPTSSSPKKISNSSKCVWPKNWAEMMFRKRWMILAYSSDHCPRKIDSYVIITKSAENCTRSNSLWSDYFVDRIPKQSFSPGAIWPIMKTFSFLISALCNWWYNQWRCLWGSSKFISSQKFMLLQKFVLTEINFNPFLISIW